MNDRSRKPRANRCSPCPRGMRAAQPANKIFLHGKGKDSGIFRNLAILHVFHYKTCSYKAIER